jgi:hypothetical protein
MILMPGDTVTYEEISNGGPFPITPGEIMDRGRHFDIEGAKGLQYSHATLKHLSVTAQMAKNNGIDLFEYEAPTGEKLELCYDYLADFYRLKDATIKGGYYSYSPCLSGNCDESPRIGEKGDSPSLFELGYRNYKDNTEIFDLISSIDGLIDRIDYESEALCGRLALTHGVSIYDFADFNTDGIVNFKDLKVLAYYWLDDTDPLN